MDAAGPPPAPEKTPGGSGDESVRVVLGDPLRGGGQRVPVRLLAAASLRAVWPGDGLRRVVLWRLARMLRAVRLPRQLDRRLPRCLRRLRLLSRRTLSGWIVPRPGALGWTCRLRRRSVLRGSFAGSVPAGVASRTEQHAAAHRETAARRSPVPLDALIARRRFPFTYTRPCGGWNQTQCALIRLQVFLHLEDGRQWDSRRT